MVLALAATGALVMAQRTSGAGGSSDIGVGFGSDVADFNPGYEAVVVGPATPPAAEGPDHPGGVFGL
jgi:hypothetical protein